MKFAVHDIFLQKVSYDSDDIFLQKVSYDNECPSSIHYNEIQL